MRSSGWLSPADGGGTERCLGLVVLVDVVLELEEPVPAEAEAPVPGATLRVLVRESPTAYAGFERAL
ncbi:hypothetical protein BE21_12395 [Sorangium cellulosum]|uniref:Uncharacterized protein n=1 Tax=Sorangium cellulosum TaxID=56 RepID=A0A150U0A2_SORCE|nr:hypothetical protein BE21_12395 [Sorangium cellulosum]